MGISERENQIRYHPLKKAHCFFFNWMAVFLCLFSVSPLFADLAPYFEKKLPVQTLALVVIPDCQALQGTALKTPLGKLWNHPQLKPLRDEIQSQWGVASLFQTNSEFALLNVPALQKKVTSAFLSLVTEPHFTNTFLPELKASPVMGFDMGAETATLTNLLHTMASSEIFSSHFKLESFEQTQSIGIPLSDQQAKAFLKLLDLFPSSFKPDKDTPVTVWITAVDSYLLVELNSPQASRLILQAARDQAPHLSEHPEWAKHKSHFSNAVFWGWAHLSPVIQKWVENESAENSIISQASGNESENPPPDATQEPLEEKEMLLPTVVGKLGLESFLSGSVAILDTPAGVCTDYFISSPEASRQGIAKIITLEPGDCSPPAFVSRDVLSFSRTRLNFTSAWDAIEKMVDEIMPDVRDLLTEALLPSILEADPNFKFKDNFIIPLGNDLTICQRLGANGEKESIRFIQIADGKYYIQTVKKLISILAPIPALEKEVSHYEVTSIPLPDLDLGASDFKTNYCHLAFKDGVLAFSTEYKLVEDFLTVSEKEEKLSSLPRLKSAAESIGALSTGFLEYTDSKRIAGNYYNKLKKYLGQDQTSTFLVPVFTFLAQDVNVNFGFLKNLVSPSLLPEFDSFADCFDFSLSAFQSTPEGFTLRTILPSAPENKAPDSPIEPPAPTKPPEQIEPPKENPKMETEPTQPATPQVHEPELMDPLPAGPEPTEPLPP